MNGDIAASVGWTTFPPTQPAAEGYDNDNYALDKAAEQFIVLRDDVLPAVGQPVFSVHRSSTWKVVIKNSTWTPLPAAAWGVPLLNDGFTKWSNGQLVIARAGVHRLSAHAQFATDKVYTYMAAQFVRNTTQPDTVDTLAKNHPLTSASVDVNGMTRLAAGDVLTLLVRQTNTAGWDLAVEPSECDLTFDVEWVRP